MTQQWYYTSDGQTNVGPVTTDELRRLARTGKLAPTDMVQMAGVPKWVPAAKVKGLFDAEPPAGRETHSVVPPADERQSPPVPTPSPRNPQQRVVALVGQLKQKYQSNPLSVLLVGGGVTLAVMFACCGGVGLISVLTGKTDRQQEGGPVAKTTPASDDGQPEQVGAEFAERLRQATGRAKSPSMTFTANQVADWMKRPDPTSQKWKEHGSFTCYPIGTNIPVRASKVFQAVGKPDRVMRYLGSKFGGKDDQEWVWIKGGTVYRCRVFNLSVLKRDRSDIRPEDDDELTFSDQLFVGGKPGF